MTEIEVAVPQDADLSHAADRIESICAGAGLTLTIKGTLNKYPGCVHWHYKKGKECGTLEITLWPRERRIWFVVHSNRAGEWIEAAISEIKPQLETALAKESS